MHQQIQRFIPVYQYVKGHKSTYISTYLFISKKLKGMMLTNYIFKRKNYSVHTVTEILLKILS